jgi:transposase-like protein
MAVIIGGKRFWLWRAVDDEGEVLDLLVQRRRDQAAAAQETRLRTRGAGERQAALLWRGKVGNECVRSP